MRWIAGRVLQALTGAACLLWIGASAPAAGDGLPAEAVQPVSAGTEQPDLNSFERRVEGIREGLAALDRIEGAYAEGDRTVTYVAFVDGALPIVVAEQWELGAQGRGEAVFHFMHGDLLRYRSRALGLAKAGAPSDGWYERAMTLYFAPGRFVGGTGAVNGRPAEPDEHEVRAAWRQAEAVKARIAAARVAGVMPADSNLARYACADGSVLAVTFDVAAARVVIELLGREPIILPRLEAGSGFLYADGAEACALWAKRRFGSPRAWTCVVHARGELDRPSPGAGQLSAVRSRREGSARLVAASADLMPAIDACLREPVGDLPRVIAARPISGGSVGVRLQNINGGRHQCVAAPGGSVVDSVEQLALDAPRVPGEGNPIFTPAAGAYPGAACFRHERVETGDGIFLGWLSVRIC